MKLENWQEIVVKVLEYKEKQDFTVKQTAMVLRKSIGWTSESLQLAHALKIYPKLEHVKSRDAALIFMRKKRDEIR